jgi:hypothetical protein
LIDEYLVLRDSVYLVTLLPKEEEGSEQVCQQFGEGFVAEDGAGGVEMLEVGGESEGGPEHDCVDVDDDGAEAVGLQSVRVHQLHHIPATVLLEPAQLQHQLLVLLRGVRCHLPDDELFAAFQRLQLSRRPQLLQGGTS